MILFLIFFFSMVLCYSKISNRDMKIVAPSILFFISIVSYFSGIFMNSFIYSNIFIILLGILSLINMGSNFIKTKSKVLEILKKNKIIVIIYVLISIVMLGFRSRVWDDFSHWLLTVRNMTIFNGLSGNPNSTIFFKTYPPATAIIQYLFNYISKFDLIKGSLEYNSQFITNYFIFIILISIIEMTKLEKKTKMILYPILFVLPAVFNSEIYISLYVDIILAILGVYIIVFYENIKDKEKNNKYIQLDMFLAVIFLSLVKSTGTAIIVFCLIYMLLDIILLKNKIIGIKTILITLVSLLIGKNTWNYYINKTNSTVVWETSKVNISNIINVLNGKGEKYQYITSNKFLKAILKEKIGIFPYIIFFILIISILMIKYIKNKEKENIKLLIFNLLVLIIYPISLLLMYIFIFNSVEAENLASYSRYMSTIVVFISIINLILLNSDKFVLKYKNIIYLLFIGLFFINTATRKLIIRKSKDIKVTNEIRNELIKTPEIIKNKNNKIYFISGDEGYYYWMYRYEVTPLKIQDWYYSDKVNLFEELKNYDYLYIKNYEEGFEEKYAKLFEEKIEKNTFYVIVKENKEIQLKKLNK